MSEESQMEATARQAPESEGAPDLEQAGFRNPGFIHLRVHTAYSLLEGAVRIPDLIKRCDQLDMPAVAVTDTGNLFGALEFSEKVSGAGIQPVIGCTLALDLEVEPNRGGVRPPDPTIALFAQNETGYLNLMALTSDAYLGTDGTEQPHVSIEALARHADGLIALTGGPNGPVNRLAVSGQKDAARALTLQLAEAFPGRLYVELQRHGTREEGLAEPVLLDTAFDNDLPIVATNEVFFFDEDDYEAHDALLCVADGTYVMQEDRRRLTPEHRFKTAGEMAALFADLPEAIAATVEIARRCAYRPRTIAPILPRFEGLDGVDGEAEELKRQAEDGLRMRLETLGAFAPEEDYWKRLEYELGIIHNMGFPGYFLIVADFIKWAKDHNIPVGPGRGSGAGSVVAWALTITDLDPLRFGLLFERFLNPERVSMPDFDVDFCQDRRDEVISYVQEKYGRDRVAQIITFGKLQARAVLRDVGRVLQMPYGQVDRLCKLVPNNPANPVTLGQAIEGEPKLQEARRSEEVVDRLIGMSLKLEGLYRHASTHAAGVVIGDRPLHELVPLYRDPRSDMPVTQFNMKWVEPAGLVKFDFLGLKTLTVIERAVELLRNRGVEVDVGALPLDDKLTYDMLSRGDTVGVFQLESSGMRDILRKMKPDRFEDIIALVALYRPGPMDNIPKYLACKKGDEEPDYLHPSLEPILTETFGIMIYQEQVMQIAQVLSGYSLGDADLLRRAMGKKIKEEMDKQKVRFVEGAEANNVDGKQAAGIFEQVAKFAGYGFNKSHAAAYALVAYQTAWLKANHPVEFLAASMNLDMGNTDKLNSFRREAQRLEIEVLPPDVNVSGADFTVIDGRISYALAAVRNVGKSAMRHLEEERTKGGVFRSVADFASRVSPKFVNKRAIENLACAGAFDRLDKNRARLHGSADRVMAEMSRAEAERESSQSSLFGDGPGAAAPDLRLGDQRDWAPMERLRHEMEAVGFYLSGHPLDDYRDTLRRARVKTYAEFVDSVQRGGGRVAKLAGTVAYKQERRAKSGNAFAFVGLSDGTGEFEAVIFSDTLATARDYLEANMSVVVGVEADVDGEDVRLKISTVQPIDKVASETSNGLRLFVDDAAALESIKSCLPPRGRGQLSLILDAEKGRKEVEITLPGTFDVTPQARGALKAIPGVVHVEDI
ncbi:DNA polymerase III subunit alpha [Pyruvatibacter mobilis]|uniref:DNA polymerase III subunit alpha n=1 Tax=Pyruvatibacter mobilis TaxID=1712261 RepID=UPI003BA898B7